MRFTLTEEQQLVQASALDWLAAHYDFRQREAGVHRDGGHATVWQAFAELGWLGLPLSEEDGGLGGDALTTGLLLQALGQHLVVEPYPPATLAAQAIDRCGTPAQRTHWLPPRVEGAARTAWAHAEPGDGGPFAPRRCTARQDGDAWVLQGVKQAVRGARSATHWLVSASVEGEREPEGGRTVLLHLPANPPGVRVDAYDTTDGASAADLYLDGARVPLDAVLGDAQVDAQPALAQLVAQRIVGACWQATGTLQAALEHTRRYMTERRQFGQALAQFQVVQHRLAEMAVHGVEAQAACELAALRVGQAQGDALQALAASVRSKVARAAQFVAQEAVQLHGAMGVCEELPIAATYRALLAFAAEDGAAPAHAVWLGLHAAATRRYADSQTLGA